MADVDTSGGRVEERRLKAGGSQDWLPRRAAEPQPNREGEEPEFRSLKPESASGGLCRLKKIFSRKKEMELL
ncbi:hypothetical protein SBA4_3660009 [Candidatus Sulfopaludibacter sp. SbA4]|nr:hypothetical protein SBA4_3660009 [Candidatus Sulfopaludibacter sp. SbA4]